MGRPGLEKGHFGLRPVRWAFDECPTFDGLTDDTTWNGFLNVWVTPAEHAKVIAWMEGDSPDPEALADMKSLTPDARGLIPYANGYTAQEVE